MYGTEEYAAYMIRESLTKLHYLCLHRKFFQPNVSTTCSIQALIDRYAIEVMLFFHCPSCSPFAVEGMDRAG